MDFKDDIKQIAERVVKLKDNLLTEEATKNALIMPFFQALGYDVFNPLEVIPEMTCDVGTKKGEKIDYAILKDGEPIMLVECKHWKENLNLHNNQLIRYFNVSIAKFGLLTNGVVYRFYTDLTATNKMDDKPFLEVNMLDLKDYQIEELKKFHKSYFDVDTILSSANELKYVGELKQVINSEFANPSPEFVKYFGKQIYDGVFNAKVSEQFTDLVRRSIASHINDKISDRLKAAMNNDSDLIAEPETVTVDTKPKVNTTQEELDAYLIVKTLLKYKIAGLGDRITWRDAQTYFSILVDDNNRKPVCRLYLNSATNKRISFIDEHKKEVVYKFNSIHDIDIYANQLVEAARRYVDIDG